MFAVAVLFVVALFLAILSQAFVSAQSVAWAVVLFGPILLLTVYIHELGHCLASRQVPKGTHHTPQFKYLLASLCTTNIKRSCRHVAGGCRCARHSPLATGRTGLCGAQHLPKDRSLCVHLRAIDARSSVLDMVCTSGDLLPCGIPPLDTISERS